MKLEILDVKGLMSCVAIQYIQLVNINYEERVN